jgi:hypothetical protein
MLGNKHVFWQALIVAFVIFWAGIFIGVKLEDTRAEEIANFYFDSETDLADFGLSSEIIFNSGISCSELNERAVFLADEIYWQALKLEKYDHSNKITKELISLHKRYDFLRTLLWNDLIQSKEKCGNEINTVVYLYKYENPSLTDRAVQGTMSNFLISLKEEYGDEVILIPIAADTGVDSLDVIREIYNLNNFPVIFVNEKYKFENINSLNEIKDVLQEN